MLAFVSALRSPPIFLLLGCNREHNYSKMSGMCDDMCNVFYDVMLYCNVVQSFVVELHSSTARSISGGLCKEIWYGSVGIPSWTVKRKF